MPDAMHEEINDIEVAWTVSENETPKTSEVFRYLLRLELTARAEIDRALFDVAREQHNDAVRQAMVDWRKREASSDD